MPVGRHEDVNGHELEQVRARGPSRRPGPGERRRLPCAVRPQSAACACVCGAPAGGFLNSALRRLKRENVQSAREDPSGGNDDTGGERTVMNPGTPAPGQTPTSILLQLARRDGERRHGIATPRLYALSLMSQTRSLPRQRAVSSVDAEVPHRGRVARVQCRQMVSRWIPDGAWALTSRGCTLSHAAP